MTFAPLVPRLAVAVANRRVAPRATPRPAADVPVLAISRTGVSDASEREADRVADAAVRTASSPSQPVIRISARVQPAPAGQSCRESGGCAGEQTEDPRRLPSSIRHDMERRLNAGLGAVRLHVGPQATAMAAQLRARAFTLGQDVFFGKGEFSPTTPRGRWLLAHELTHTVQQRANPPGRPLLQRAPVQGGEGEPDPTITSECEAHKYDLALIREALITARRLARAKLADVDRVIAAPDKAKQRSLWNDGPFACWFGEFSRGRTRHVRRMLVNTLGFLRDPSVTIECREPAPYSEESYKRPEYWASASPSRKLITLRKVWYQSQYPLTRNPDPHPDTLKNAEKHAKARAGDRARTLVHEAAHLAGANRVLKDTYDANSCIELAKGSPWRAVRNADNYGWFVVDPRAPTDGCMYEQEKWKEMRMEWDKVDSETPPR